MQKLFVGFFLPSFIHIVEKKSKSEVRRVQRDLFEDVRKIVGCDYISDLPKYPVDVKLALRKLDKKKYDTKQIKDLLEYIRD